MMKARLLLARCCRWMQWPLRCRCCPLVPALTLLILLVPPAALLAQVAQANQIVKFQLRDGYLIIVPILVNGSGPYPFLLDTGTTRTVIGPALANQLHAAVIGEDLLAGIPHARALPQVRLNTIQMSSASVSNLTAMVDKLEAVKFLAPGIQGILGEDFLSRFDLFIDYKQRTVQFGEFAPAGERCRFESMGKYRGARTINRLLIGTEIAEVSGGKLQLQLDTGAKFAEIFPASRATFPSQPWSGFLPATSGESGKVLHSRITLKIGSTVVKDQDVIQNLQGYSLDAVGLLPAVLFRSIYICHSGGYVVLNPVDENRRPHRGNRELAASEQGD